MSEPNIGDQHNAGAADAPDFSSPDTFTAFRDSLPDEMKGHAFFANAKDFSDFANQAFNAHKMVGVDKIPAPGKDWGDKEWGDFYTRLGRPEAPEKYAAPGLEAGKEAEYPVDAESLKKIQAAAHSAGLNQKQFEAVVSVIADDIKASRTSMEEGQQTTLNQFVEKIKGEWKDATKTNVELAMRAFDAEAPDELKELVAQDPLLANHPGIIKLFHKIGKSLLENSRVPGSPNPSFGEGTSAEAQQKLSSFEAQHGKILFSPLDRLTPEEKASREAILAERTRLYELAFPAEKTT